MFAWFGKVNYCPHTKVAGFARQLKDGRLTASQCAACGRLSFPPRADCPDCRHGQFSFRELSGRGNLATYTRIETAPAGFEDLAPYTLGVVDLQEGGRLLAWFGGTIPPAEIAIGMPVQVVPRIFEECEEIRVHYTLEVPGTCWVSADTS